MPSPPPPPHHPNHKDDSYNRNQYEERGRRRHSPERGRRMDRDHGSRSPSVTHSFSDFSSPRSRSPPHSPERRRPSASIINGSTSAIDVNMRREEESGTVIPNKIFVDRLTRNVTAAHLHEIFEAYGRIKQVGHAHGKQFAWIEYEAEESVERAIRCMNGGQLDGNVLGVSVFRHFAKRERPHERRREREGERHYRDGRSPQRHSYHPNPYNTHRRNSAYEDDRGRYYYGRNDRSHQNDTHGRSHHRSLSPY